MPAPRRWASGREEKDLLEVNTKPEKRGQEKALQPLSLPLRAIFFSITVSSSRLFIMGVWLWLTQVSVLDFWL